MTRDLEANLTQIWGAVQKQFRSTERSLALIYRAAFRQTEAEMIALYAKLAGNLDLTEANRYGRLENLRKSIAAEYRKATGKAIKQTERVVKDSLTTSYEGTRWAYDQAIGTSLTLGKLPVDAIRAAVLNENSGADLIKTFRVNGAKQIAKTQADIVRAIATGESAAKAAQRIKADFNNAFNDAVRVVRTEGMRAYDAGHQIAYERAVEKGIKLKKYWKHSGQSVDTGARADHIEMDMVEADENGNFHTPWGEVIPYPHASAFVEHVANCACSIIETVEDSPGETPDPLQGYGAWQAKNGFDY